MPGLLDQATARYRAGDLAGSFEAAIEALRGGGPAAAGTLALLCLAEAGQLGSVDPLLALVRDRGAAPVEFCRQACADLLAAGKRGALATLANGMPRDHPLRVLALYHAACARMVAGDMAGALEEFEQFRLEVKGAMALVPFLASDRFNVCFRQGTLVLPAASVDRRLAAADGLPPAGTGFRLDRPAAGVQAALHAVFADGRYVARFAGALARGLDAPDRALHIHVVNATPEADALLAGLAGTLDHLALGISRSEDRHYATATAYACARFFILPELLRLYRRPIIALDIDLVPRPALARLEGLLADDAFDFACYLTGRNEPASVYQASVMAWPPNAATFDFLDRLGRFCLPRLALPIRANWMLDQAALTSILSWQAVRGIPFRFRPLNEILGGTLADAIAPVATEEEKGAIKEQSGGIAGLVDESGMVHYDWSPD